MIILGCGYLGQALVRRYRQQGLDVTGVVRSPASAAAVAAAGGQPLRLDLTCDALTGLDTAGAHVFHLAPPSSHPSNQQAREPANAQDQDALTMRIIDHFARQGQPKRLVYVSTTGVYGDCAGAWVDESRPPNPGAGRSKRRWDAEQRLQQWSRASGAELVILRVAGIYACDRLPLERIRSGQPVIKTEEAPWSNRIHAKDLTTICAKAMERAPTGAILNVCDGHPSTMTDYFCRVADAAGLPQPPQIPLAEAEGQVSAGMLSYLRESRRLSNRRMLEELQIELEYPSLEVGLAACFDRTRP